MMLEDTSDRLSDSYSTGSAAGENKFFGEDPGLDGPDDDQEDSGTGSAALSMLLSYYGTESAADTTAMSAADLIKSPCFKPLAYVKDLLDTKSVPELIRHDAQLLSEVRTLDNDMQMLIYENYNKFISATETIKRMKNNVESMESDMISVSRKMEAISVGSQYLDDSLAGKRSKVDKLVRVRRLLQRLEFFSELPERLERMISKEKYLEAVDLYTKVITILTKYSHILSFKNIQERTVSMMADLRVKVLDLFEKDDIEAVKMTQYVTILRLMQASRESIVSRLLQAHRTRATKLITDFASSDVQTSVQGSQKVTKVRQFHQFSIVGLIEAAKGIHEAYSDVIDSPEYNAAVNKAYDDLQLLMSKTIPSHTQCLVKSFSEFFSSFGSVDNDMQFEEEKQAWAMLAKQIIVDTENLDNIIESCRPMTHIVSTSHAETVAKEIFSVLDFHVDSCLKKAKASFYASINSCVESIRSVVLQISSDLELSTDDHALSKASIQRKFASVKPSIESLTTKFFEALSDFFTSVKPIVDVHVVSYLGKKNPIKILLQRFSNGVSSVVQSLVADSRFYTELCDVYTPEVVSKDGPNDFVIRTTDSLEQSLFILVTATSFKHIAEISFSKLDIILRESDFDVRSISIEDKDSFSQSFLNLSSIAAIAFVELRSSMAIALLPNLFSDANSRTHSEELILSDRALEICRILAESALLASLVFNEALPTVKALPTEVRRAGRQSIINRNFQFDIDRMFSAKVKVFDYTASSTSVSCCTTEGALVTVCKAVLKSSQELIRCKILNGSEAVFLTLDLQFIKQVSATLSKDSAQQVDSLFDQVQQAIRMRTHDPEAILDSTDPMAMARVVNGGISVLAKSSVIFQQR